MNAEIDPKDAIARVRERGDVIKWEDSGHTFIVRKPDDADEIVTEYALERHYGGEVYPQPSIKPFYLLNVLNSRDFCVVSKAETRL